MPTQAKYTEVMSVIERRIRQDRGGSARRQHHGSDADLLRIQVCQISPSIRYDRAFHDPLEGRPIPPGLRSYGTRSNFTSSMPRLNGKLPLP